MGPDYLRDRLVFGSVAQPGESSTDYRERITQIQAEALKRREQELQEQGSPSNTPSARIQIWERLHQVALPRNPAHALIAIIASQTGLTVDDVLMEQQLRLRPRAEAAPPSI